MIPSQLRRIKDHRLVRQIREEQERYVVEAAAAAQAAQLEAMVALQMVETELPKEYLTASPRQPGGSGAGADATAPGPSDRRVILPVAPPAPAQGAAAAGGSGGDDGGDGDNEYGDDELGDDDADDDEEAKKEEDRSQEVGQPPRPPKYWTKYEVVRDGSPGAFHSYLNWALNKIHRRGHWTVEYHCTQLEYSKAQHTDHWRTECYICVASERRRGAVVRLVHPCLAPRTTAEATVQDAARQALSITLEEHQD
jgi:hypothetical protein